jgi:hypothetical protein
VLDDTGACSAISIKHLTGKQRDWLMVTVKFNRQEELLDDDKKRDIFFNQRIPRGTASGSKQCYSELVLETI